MKLVYLEECDSTQDYLKNQTGELEIFDAVYTSKQTKGRGRRGNDWISFEGSLAFSIILPLCKIPTLTSLKIGYLVAEFLMGMKAKVKLKWPNDIVLGDQFKKVGGILIESSSSNKCIVGIGLNVLSAPNSDFNYGSSSLSESGMTPMDLPEFATLFHQYFKDNFYKISDQQLTVLWSRHCFHLNQKVILTDGATNVSGIFNGVDQSGAALINCQAFINGSLRLA
jgi:BirA family biotin operon repressor/biotin-[acetyl-CoA-carboxylase] ligase